MLVAVDRKHIKANTHLKKKKDVFPFFFLFFFDIFYPPSRLLILILTAYSRVVTGMCPYCCCRDH